MVANNTVTMSRHHGRVNRRFNPKRGTWRLRFTSVHEEQAQTILCALDRARQEAETEYDVVALEMICMNYLATSSSKRLRRLPRQQGRRQEPVGP